MTLLALLALALLALQVRAQRQPQSPRLEAFPREEPVTMPGYCPTRGEKARDWQAGELEGCTMLDLYRQGLTAELMSELSVALAMHGESVTRLELARQMLVDPEAEGGAEDTAGAQATYEMLDANRQITVVRLGENRFGPAQAAVLSPAAGAGSGLTALLLDKNTIGPEGAASLAVALVEPESSLTELDLNSNGLGDGGAEALGGAVGNDPQLSILNLDSNAITPTGASALGQALRSNSHLTRLSLRQNPLSDEGASAVAQALAAAGAAGGLLSLDLFMSGAADGAAERFAELLEAGGAARWLAPPSGC